MTGLFYPPMVIVEGGVLLLQGLGVAQNTAPNRHLALVGLLAVLGVLMPYLWAAQSLGTGLNSPARANVGRTSTSGTQCLFL